MTFNLRKVILPLLNSIKNTTQYDLIAEHILFLNSLPDLLIPSHHREDDDLYQYDPIQGVDFAHVQKSLLELISRYNQVHKHPPLLNTPNTPCPGYSSDDLSSSFSTFTFNVLADCLSGSHPQFGNFVGPPRECLKWEYRKWRILEALLQSSAHAICLQELDLIHMKTFVGPMLSVCGYWSAYRAKPQPSAPRSSLRDGCLVAVTSPIISTWSWQLGEANNQVLVAVRTVYNSYPVIIASTHLKSSKTPMGEFTRSRQATMAVSFLASISSDARVVLGGDFNSSYRQSPQTNYPPLAYPAAMENEHLPLRSAYTDYKHLQGCEGAPDEAPYTTCKTRDKGLIKHTIDYIFTNVDNHIVGLKEIPNEKMLPEYGLPTWQWPSDHLCLQAWLRFP